MLGLKTKKELASEAYNFARGSNLVRYHGVTYIPADFETLETSVPPDPDRTIWQPLTQEKIRRIAAEVFGTLFANDSELRSFMFMVAQSSDQVDEAVSSLLVRTPTGLRELNEHGQLVDATGEFRPNALLPVLNEDQAEKDRVFNVIAEWLDSDEEAESLLSHLATSLAPGWSAVKFIILLGDGRNGKGLLMSMLAALFGADNVSNVTRQQIAEKSPVVTDLNGKLLNIVYDGEATYLKDSGTEKTLVAGEPVSIKLLYESVATRVQTNALFIESLNKEPKTHDKSSALQKRLVRFRFDNIYALNHRFARSMLSAPALGAFLSLLIDRYVEEDSVAERLVLTEKAIELQLEQMYTNSLGLQFLKYIEMKDTFGTAGLIGRPITDLVPLFHSWRVSENDIGTWSEPDIIAQFTSLLNTERLTVRMPQGPRKIRTITSFKQDARAFIDSLEGADSDAALLESLVGDGDL